MATKIIEILQYTLHAGSGADFHRCMHDISIPLHRRHGIDVIGYGNSLDDADSYYLIRAFDNQQQMKKSLQLFYSSDEWRNGPREAIVSRIAVSVKSVLLLSPPAIEALRATGE